MRKYSFILMTFALLLGMAQCKKESTIPNGDNNEGVRITLKVDDGPSTGSGTDDGEKLNVYPATGAVIFTDGDKIYVGNNGKYVGTLTFESGLFQGTIEGDLSSDDYLHFYFVGNKPTSPSALAAGTTSYTVDISDQTAGLPAISYAPSTAKYSPSTTAYTARLLNKSALVKFVPSEATALPITVSGLKNEVQIDFANHTLAPSGTTGGITLYSVSDTEKWAILLAQEAVSDATVTIRGYEASASLPPITNNMYYNSGVGISMTATVPAGAIDGKFTINANGDKVYFSQGNLRYKTDKGWQFTTPQYDFIGSYNTNNWVDMFYQGNWGNPYPGFNWRRPSLTELIYVFNTRTTSSGIRYAKGRIEIASGQYKNGMILLPDDWASSIYELSNTNVSSANYDSNTITVANWESIFEANGAVFLPAAGNYNGNDQYYNNNSAGHYWTSGSGNSIVIFRTWTLEFIGGNAGNNGYSIRLVCPVG